MTIQISLIEGGAETYCVKCGTQLPNDATFCMKCGAAQRSGASAAAESITLMAAAGAVVHLFPTGQGNVIGNPIEPVVKITGNPITAETTAEHVDLDVSGLLTRTMTLADAGRCLLGILERTINGRLTCAEVLRHREFVLTRLYESA